MVSMNLHFSKEARPEPPLLTSVNRHLLKGWLDIHSLCLRVLVAELLPSFKCVKQSQTQNVFL